MALEKKEDKKNSDRPLEIEVNALYEISKAITSSLDLERVMNRVLEVLNKNMGMERGTITLLDAKTGDLLIEVAQGLEKEQIELGRYRVGEGVTGKVVAAGEPMVVPNLDEEPLFLNKTGARKNLDRKNIAFICVPIKLHSKVIGALSADRLFKETVSFEEDVKFLTIIASMLAQAVHIHEMVSEKTEKLKSENTLLKIQLKKTFHPANIIGESKRMADVFASIELVSESKATVLLRGESGTGKELVAHAIHYNSDRAEGPFVKISCAALPDTLLESELFGYEKGAFTGATTRKKGRFELANGGTLFLDEIGDIPHTTQVKLLRVLQEREFERLGGTESIRVNIRLITATNRDLEKEVQDGNFRQDLYYRLNVIPIFLPSLKERKEDIPMLVNHFLHKANQENGKDVKYISDKAMEYLLEYSWPGNVRELENAMERAVVLCKTNIVEADLFPIPGSKNHPVSILASSENSEEKQSAPIKLQGDNGLTDAVEELEKQLISDAMERAKGNQRKASKILGITERILGYKLKRYALKD